MKLGFQHLVCLGLPILLYACGSDTPSFVEKPESIITLTVDDAAVDDDTFDMDELLSDEDESLPVDDAVAVTAAESTEAGDESAADDGRSHGNGNGNGQKSKDTRIASNENDSQSADATPVSNTPDSGNDTGSSDSTPDTAYDAKAVAKACQPYFRGLSQKFKVVDSMALSSLSVAPGTVIAFKVTSNHSSLTVHLPAGNDLPGVCFFVSGNQATVRFSTASTVEGLAYIAAGNQSSGAIEFLGGSPARSHIELKGHEASLDVLGLDTDLCQGAVLKGTAPRFQCNP
ncbi:hypothetical protein [Oligoflexus tunisiensis]|uniref:hypothetical protein n=1 Tax=Oligoflexus tunisiensis TaxID=708132 RepID=UPI00114C997F|nr:hypothetical protein [Oligoflexus tunisiensis]